MSVTLKCQNCSKEFEAQRSTAKFCSDACKVAFNRQDKAGDEWDDWQEDYGSWLTRRIEETGSARHEKGGCGAHTVKTGAPTYGKIDRASGTLVIPFLFEIEDIEVAKVYKMALTEKGQEDV